MSPRMHGPSQESTGSFFAASWRVAYVSPAGQSPVTPCTSSEKCPVCVLPWGLLPSSECRATGFMPVDEQATRNDTADSYFPRPNEDEGGGPRRAGELVLLVVLEVAGTLERCLQGAAGPMEPDLRGSDRNSERIRQSLN